jgi:hypothetical protein
MSQQSVAKGIGWLLALVGVLGFFFTDTIIIFGTNLLHNIVHLVIGVLGILAAMKAANSVLFNKIAGVVFLLLTLLGLVASGTMTNLLNVNMADNLLHLVLGAFLAYTGFKK